MKVDAYAVTASFEKVVLMTMMYLCFGVQFLLIENGVVDLRCYPFSSWSRQNKCAVANSAHTSVTVDRHGHNVRYNVWLAFMFCGAVTALFSLY